MEIVLYICILKILCEKKYLFNNTSFHKWCTVSNNLQNNCQILCLTHAYKIIEIWYTKKYQKEDYAWFCFFDIFRVATLISGIGQSGYLFSQTHSTNSVAHEKPRKDTSLLKLSISKQKALQQYPITEWQSSQEI